MALCALSISLALLGCPRATRETSEAVAKPMALTQAELRDRSERIVSYFSERSKRRAIVATTVTMSGQTIDWIRPESQVPEGRLAAPPASAAVPRDPGGRRNPFLGVKVPLEQEERTARTELQADERALGPEGTVPMVRFDAPRYLALTKTPPRDPREVLRKIPPPAPDVNDRYYVAWQRFGEFFGSAGRINVWDTSGPGVGETSIAQTAVIRGDPMQAIEAGKIELESLNGNAGSYFFTYYRTGDDASGDWLGGYNTLVDGWIQYSRRVAPGVSIAAWNSQTGGDQYSLDVEVRLHEGNWWVWAAGEWAGYYPHCRGADAPPCDEGTLFSEEGIRDIASRLDWYGEVYDSSSPAPTSTDMGSGTFASDGWQRGAYFRNLTFFWQPATYWWWDSEALSVTDPACYSGDGPFYSAEASWRNWFFFGGPGKENRDCD